MDKPRTFALSWIYTYSGDKNTSKIPVIIENPTPNDLENNCVHVVEMSAVNELLDALKYYAHQAHYEERQTMTELRKPGVLIEGGEKARELLKKWGSK